MGVDCQTEYFNGREWKSVSQYTKDEFVLQYKDDKTAELVIPTSYQKRKNNSMFLFETKSSLNQCLSSAHMSTYITSKGNISCKKFEDVIDLHNTSKQGFSGRFITSFIYNSKTKLSLTDNEIKLMVAVIADASFQGRENNCYFNLKKERKKRALRKILNEMEYSYVERTYDSMPGYTRFLLNAPLKEKEFTKKWYLCNNTQRQIICDSVLNWDGSQQKNKRNELIRRNFYTTSKESADFIQFVFASCGYCANLIVQDRRGRIKKNETNNREYVTKSIDYVVGISNQTLKNLARKSSQGKIKINNYIPSDGYEYFFSVPSKQIVFRRKNKIFISGDGNINIKEVNQ